jgi:hypothetical protein
VLVCAAVPLAVAELVSLGNHVTVHVAEGVPLVNATFVAGLGVVLGVVSGISGVGVAVAQNGPSFMTGLAGPCFKLG